jgi:signal peptidase I
VADNPRLGGTFVKRLIGLPGERVTETDGRIFVDGRALREPYIRPEFRGHENGAWPRIAAGHYFFLGDNRIDSCDSRTWGTVSRGALIGPVVLTYWPPGRASIR